MSDENVLATTSGGDWLVSREDVGNLNGCAGECVWQNTVVEIQDPTRTAAETCGDYTPDIEVCTTWLEQSPTRSAPVESTCEAGSGRFRLIPRRLVNKDADAYASVIMTPIQISGTGALTGEAWITSLDIVEDQGKTLRILKPNRNFHFNGTTDMLEEKNTVSLLLLAENDFIVGKISGGAPIVVEEIAIATTPDFEVDLTWSCGTVPVAGERHPSQGYMVSPADLDCTGDWVQEFTLRPIPYLSPQWLHAERYGHVEDREAIKLTPAVAGGYNFDHKRGVVRFRGNISSMSPNGATLTVTEASVAGVNVCDTGTYSLTPEQ